MINTKYYDMAAILPHKPPMIFVDRVLEYDLEKRTASASFTVTESSIFHDSKMGGVSAWTCIEYMAQTIGILSGILETESGLPAGGIAFLLGSRRVTTNIEIFEVGKTYTVHVSETFYASDLGSYSCIIKDGDKICAEAEINAYKPRNPLKILEME